MNIAERVWDTLVRRGLMGWDLTPGAHIDTGERFAGTDYYQMMILWAMPATMAGQDLSGPCQEGGLVDRVIKAGRSIKL